MNPADLPRTGFPASNRADAIRVAVLMASISRKAGGLYPAVQALSEGLLPLDCEIRVFGGIDEHTLEDQAEWAPVPLSLQPVVGPKAIGFQRGLVARLESYCPDLLHVHGIWMYPSLATARWSAGRRPYVISPHGMLDPWAVRNSAWKKWIAALLYENAHLAGAACLHALCDAERDAIRAYGLKNPVCVIPNGVDLPTASSGVPPPWAGEVPAGAKVLLYLGRIHPKKGLPALLAAWAATGRRGALADDWFLVIAGWDQNGHQHELETLASELGIGERIRFVGPQFGLDKQASYERAQAFVLPSLSEGLPMTVLEAWSHGLPVLMTPQCNLPVGFECAAALAMEPEVEDAVRCLGDLSAMSERDRQAMGRRGRQLVADRFTWDTISLEMLAVYRWVLGGDARPSSVDLHNRTEARIC